MQILLGIFFTVVFVIGALAVVTLGNQGYRATAAGSLALLIVAMFLLHKWQPGRKFRNNQPTESKELSSGKKIGQYLYYVAFALWVLGMAISVGVFGQDPSLIYIAAAAGIGFLIILFFFQNPNPFTLSQSNWTDDVQGEGNTSAQTTTTKKYLFYFSLGAFVLLFGIVAAWFAVDKGLLGNLDKSYLSFAWFCAVAALAIIQMVRIRRKQ